MHSPTPKRIENTLPSARSLLCVSTHLLNSLNVSYHLTGFYTEAHDLEACNRCNSFSWNKAGDFRTPILYPNMDKNNIKIEVAREGKYTSYVISK